MTVSSRIIQKLDAGGTINGSDIADLVNEHRIPRERMIGLYNRYKCDADESWYCVGNSPSIFERRFNVDLIKVNNTINLDHFSNLIRTKTGYFLGEPIQYSIDEEAPNKELVYEKLKYFLRKVDAADLDTETAKLASICGYGARLLYLDRDGEACAMNVNPWEAILLSKSDNVAHPEYAVRYYKDQIQKADGSYKDVMKVEFYDSKYVSFWTEAAIPEPTPGTEDPATVYKPMWSYGFVLDPEHPPMEHMFDGVPLIGFANNAELQGDAEKVLTIIDAVDRTMSDVNSEIEQFRLAYLAVYGVGQVDDEFLENLKRTGVLAFTDKEDKAEFITKNLDSTTIEQHLTRLEQAIYNIAGIPDMRDAAFSGNSSGVALKFKLLPMENLCRMSENKFTASLRQMFTVLASKWALEQVVFDADDLVFKFKRNFPLNLLDEAQTAQALTGIVSQETVLGTLSIVKNPKDESEKMKRERDDDVNLDMVYRQPVGGETGGQEEQGEEQGEMLEE